MFSIHVADFPVALFFAGTPTFHTMNKIHRGARQDMLLARGAVFCSKSQSLDFDWRNDCCFTSIRAASTFNKTASEDSNGNVLHSVLTPRRQHLSALQCGHVTSL